MGWIADSGVHSSNTVAEMKLTRSTAGRFGADRTKLRLRGVRWQYGSFQAAGTGADGGDGACKLHFGPSTSAMSTVVAGIMVATGGMNAIELMDPNGIVEAMMVRASFGSSAGEPQHIIMWGDYV